jgi:hypothetical protein
VVTFGGLLQEAGKMCGGSSPLVLFVDGIYLMDNTHQPCNLEWLPHPLPPVIIYHPKKKIVLPVVVVNCFVFSWL